MKCYFCQSLREHRDLRASFSSAGLRPLTAKESAELLDYNKGPF
jgi:hypothetical protein